ncbi:LamG-like jellyroll fold domain-containing protein [Streptomyces sp. NPDC102264]|uniref:LamG-like jellyroll fold domain-containing protein n=1 Tax=Streptomyces sp. NPDC102264 TaxID=3366149 RepID=UPI0038309795
MPHPGRNLPLSSDRSSASPDPSLRGAAGLSDRELVRITLRASGGAEAAARELFDRHRGAATAYAAQCTTTPTAAALLLTSAEFAATQSFLVDGGSTAWRPYLLNTLVRTAAEWAAGDKQHHLAPELCSWLAESGGVVAGPVQGNDTAGVVLLVQAFHQLPERLQVVLWHRVVDQEDIAQVARCTGTSQDAVRIWADTVEDKFLTVYGRLYEETAAARCRPFSRLVLTTARTGLPQAPGDGGASGLEGHLATCGNCDRVFRHLSRPHGHEWGPPLAESLLPWGGGDYCAGRAVVRAGEPPTGATAGDVPPASSLRLRILRTRALRTRSGRALVAAAVAGAVLGVVLLSTGDSDPAPGDPAATLRGSHDSSHTWSGSTTSPKGPGPSPSVSPSASKSFKSSTSSSKPPADPPSTSKSPPGPKPGKLTDARLRWDFENAGERPEDTSAAGLPGSYHGRVEWSDDRNGSVWFNGVSYVETSRAVVDTARSFTVSAWARLTSNGEFYTVAAQDGGNISGFFLQYAQDDNRWRLAMGQSDSTEAGEDEAESAGPPAMDTWQHLTGVFDAEKRQIRLYVDGRLQSTAAHRSTWNANGSFTVGRGLWEGDEADQYKGYVDDVRAYQRAMSASEISALASAGPNG